MEITVIIPTYKPGAYLHDCLTALINQTLAVDCYSILVVLNGCNDPYYAQINKIWLEEARSKGIEATCIQTDEGGVSRARNVGLDSTQSKYVCFIDDDDVVSPVYLERLLAVAAQDTVVAANVHLTDWQLQTTEPDFFLDKAFRNYDPMWQRSLFRCRKFLSNVCGKLIPMTVIGNRRFDPDMALGEDSLFMFIISDRINGVVITSPDAVYYARQRSSSATRRPIAYSTRLRVCVQLVGKYTALWVKRPRAYCFPFFLSRVAATVFKLFLRNYR